MQWSIWTAANFIKPGTLWELVVRCGLEDTCPSSEMIPIMLVRFAKMFTGSHPLFLKSKRDSCANVICIEPHMNGLSSFNQMHVLLKPTNMRNNILTLFHPNSCTSSDPTKNFWFIFVIIFGLVFSIIPIRLQTAARAPCNSVTPVRHHS